MQPLININGITVKQLKELVKEWPDENEFGHENLLWLENYGSPGFTNVAKQVCQLGKSDILISAQNDL
jgi:hypothetical protein